MGGCKSMKEKYITYCASRLVVASGDAGRSAMRSCRLVEDAATPGASPDFLGTRFAITKPRTSRCDVSTKLGDAMEGSNSGSDGCA